MPPVELCDTLLNLQLDGDIAMSRQIQNDRAKNRIEGIPKRAVIRVEPPNQVAFALQHVDRDRVVLPHVRCLVAA